MVPVMDSGHMMLVLLIVFLIQLQRILGQILSKQVLPQILLVQHQLGFLDKNQLLIHNMYFFGTTMVIFLENFLIRFTNQLAEAAQVAPLVQKKCLRISGKFFTINTRWLSEDALILKNARIELLDTCKLDRTRDGQEDRSLVENRATDDDIK